MITGRRAAGAARRAPLGKARQCQRVRISPVFVQEKCRFIQQEIGIFVWSETDLT